MLLVDGTLRDGDRVLISGLPPELGAVADPRGNGIFLDASAETTSSRLSFGAGTIPRLARYTACHRYEPYWMKPHAGTRLSELPPETQSLVARLDDGCFLLVVPLFDELTRFSLRGHPDGSLVLIAETGDAFLPTAGGLALYVAAGADPFELARRGAESVQERLGSGRLRRDKPLPDFVERLGWCTWDAFYHEVSEEKVLAGLESFRQGGVSPSYLILDDGWQSRAQRPTGEWRLTGFGTCERFPNGLGSLVRRAKSDFGIESFLVWHAMVGYWGGIDATALGGYGVIEQTRQFGDGVLFHKPNFNHECWGNLVGFVPAEHIERFFDDYHRALASEGVDGVKVDNQAVLEGLALGQGGRVKVNRAYRKALGASVSRHFSGRLINCMSNAQETWYGTPDSTLLRSSMDFLPTKPDSHGAHVYANAQVGVWFGEFMQPDWDMFQSGHEWGEYHAAARAISGGPVYVSDKPGVHDFALIGRLLCSDGSVLRADFPARPTLDVLFCDPTLEDVLFKIWNRSGARAVVGVFNARVGSAGMPGPVLRGKTGPLDVPDLGGERFASYRHVAKTFAVLAREDCVVLELAERGFEIVTFAPIERDFAALGLGHKLNGAAAVVSSEWSGASVTVTLRDGGPFVAYSKERPSAARVGEAPVAFEHDATSGALSVQLRQAGRQALVLSF